MRGTDAYYLPCHLFAIPDEFYSKHEVSSNIYYAALLHDHPQLLDDCCELINMEWKRSHTARLI